MDATERILDPLITATPGRWTRVPLLAIPLTALALVFALLVILGSNVDGIAWHQEGMVTAREYRDIVLTDLQGDGNYEVGGILKEIQGEDPSAEFHTFSGDSWELMAENISYRGYYNDLAISGPLITAGHAGGNSVDAWFYNQSTGEFDFSEPDPSSQIKNWSLSVAIGDLNNDSYPDIVAGFKERGLKIFYGTENGSWIIGETPKTSGMVKAVLIGDLNNDTHLDIVNTHKEWEGQPNDPKKIELWIGDGEGNWTPKNVVSDTNIDYSTISSARLNEDGFPDIIAGSDSKEGIDRYVYQPVGSFWERSQIFSKGTYSSLILKDVDGDWIPDIIGNRFDDKGVIIYLGNGDGSFDSDDVGPVQVGNVWTSILYDFNEDDHVDILVANRTGLYYWVQALPEIKNVVIPEIMYAMHRSYDLSLDVTSEALREDPDNLEFVRMRCRLDENITFILTYNAGSGQFKVEQGTDMVVIDPDNSSRTDIGDGKVHINFNVMFKWGIPDLDSGNGSIIQAYMKEERGSTGWVDLDPGPWRIVSSVTVKDFMVLDATLNPGARVDLSGVVLYAGSEIPVVDDFIRWVEIHSDGLDDASAYDIVNATFSLNFTLPEETGDYLLWPEVFMNRGEAQPTPIPLPRENVTLSSDYVVVTDMWITGETFYDFNTHTSWQRSGEGVTFHTHAKYQHTGLAYEGELALTNGTASFNTTGRNIDLMFEYDGLLTLQLVPANDSAFANEYGPMLRSEVEVIPRAVWDGEAPIILDFAEGSLVNGSEIKAVDAEISILVSEKGLMDPFEARGYGTFTIFWSIIQDENTTFNGSGTMNKAWSNQNYTFSYDLPISQAETDNIVLFWFAGNDTVGNDLLSDLWPRRCTREDPGTILVDPRPPAPPQDPFTNVGDGYIEVRWKANQEEDLAGYRVYRSTDGVNFSLSPISGISLVRYNYFLDEGLQNGKTYYYRITAVDRAVIPNESDYSEITSGTPKEDEPDDLVSLVKEHVFIVFIIAVVIILLIGIVVIMVRSRTSESTGPNEPDTHSPSSPAQPPSSFPSVSPLPSSSFPSISPPPSSSLPFVSPPSSSSFPSSNVVRQAKIMQPPPTVQPAAAMQSYPETPSQPTDASMGQNVPTTTPVFPQVDWTCPSCTHQIKLLQGERFCTNCGYKIR